jgi:Mn2+/Fe2+ NRAMP family transporter
VQVVFLVYLVLWSFVVAGALINACGLAAHALVPGLSVEAWGAVHSLAAAALVLLGGYARFEKLVGLFVGVMFVTLVGTALVVESPVRTAVGVIASAGIPDGSGRYLLGVIGGVGGSVTLLSYGYWIREKGWEGEAGVRTVRLDLAVAYVLTGAFGLAVMVLAANVLHAGNVEIGGASGVLRMASMLDDVIGPAGHWIFLVGVWGAMTTSMLGVWQGVPYLFDDFVGLMRRRRTGEARRPASTRSAGYRGFLLWLALPPMTTLVLGRPVQLIVVYAVTSALFMPFLAATLLYMNSRTDWVGPRARSGAFINGALILCLVLFGYLAWQDIVNAIRT